MSVKNPAIPIVADRIDATTMDLIRESCDAYISGTDYAFIATDAVWFAVVNVENLNVAIEDYITSMES